MTIKITNYTAQINYGSSGRGSPKGAWPDSSSWTDRPSFTRYRNYGVSSNFKDRVKQRKLDKKAGIRSQFLQLPMNPYFDQQTKYSYGQDSLVYHEGSNPNAVDFGCYAIPIVTNFIQPGYLPMAEHVPISNKCIQKLPSRMNGTNFNLPLFLAEAHKSVAMVTKAASMINKVILKTRERVNNRHGRKINGTYVPFVKGREAWQKDLDLSLHNMWLEYRYGWRLLLKDIIDSLKATYDLYNSSLKQRVTCADFAVTERTFVQPGTVNGRLGGYFGPQQWDVTVTEKCRYDVKYVIYYRDNNPQLGTMQQYGITNPFLLAWELVPYSFVVDWFVPVGNLLQGLDAFLGKEFLAGTVSYTYDEQKTFTFSNPMYPQWWGWGVPCYASDPISQPSTSSHRAFQRFALGSFPTQNLPFIDVNLNYSRCADAIGLLLQQKEPLKSAWASVRKR